jgi:hypothetical protein
VGKVECGLVGWHRALLTLAFSCCSFRLSSPRASRDTPNLGASWLSPGPPAGVDSHGVPGKQGTAAAWVDFFHPLTYSASFGTILVFLSLRWTTSSFPKSYKYSFHLRVDHLFPEECQPV